MYFAQRYVTPAERAEIWDQVAEIREREGDPVRAEWARHNAASLRDLAKRNLVVP